MSYTNELSSLSYTNKDFNSIYVELLEYAKKLSYNWDPTASDESDPGVVLLKLCALIGDKNNYNIDKSVLELLPASVTQMPAARQLFEQCGYSMHYYRSAEGYVHLEVNDKENATDYTYTVPMFTMITDNESSVVYTTTEELVLTSGEDTSISVIEGTATPYTINNDSLITLSNLDYKNRLYFTETDIAENGIFITNAGKNNYSSWKRVENLQTQPAGSLCYKFGVSLNSDICFIEFPSDVDLIFEGGINITYIRTRGATGNIAANKLKKFYRETEFIKTHKVNIEDANPIKVSTAASNDSENTSSVIVSITNTEAITNGKDVESIEDAYKSYKRVRDTFSTLVSLKDYTDYMVTSESASNGYVCDRTNDIQHAYKILEVNTYGESSKTFVEDKAEQVKGKLSSGETVDVEITAPAMDAYNLCIYALEYVPTVDTESLFHRTFTLGSSEKYIEQLQSEQIKSLQHNFIDYDLNRILMLKNKFAIHSNIIPKYKFGASSDEANQVKLNIEKALYNKINSKELSFGEEIDYNLIFDTISTADDRIKAISLDYPVYETYAVYKNENGIQEIRIDDESIDGGYVVTNFTSSSFNSFPDKDKLYYLTPRNQIKPVGDKKYSNTVTYYTFDEDKHALWNKFRSEIFAKNVLAGVTPLYDQDTTFSYGVNQADTTEYPGVVTITSEAIINFDSSTDGTVWTSRVIEDNESVILTAPSIIEENHYSGLKIIYDLPSVQSDMLQSNTNYELQDNDFIVFLYKKNEDTDYRYIKYDNKKSSLANILMLDAPMSKIQGGVPDYIKSYFRSEPSGTTETTANKSIENPSGKGGELITLTKYVQDSLISTKETSKQYLNSSEVITTKKPNKTLVNSEKNGSKHVYWILNNTVTRNDKLVYELFDAKQNSYVLGSGEYFIYTNNEKTSLIILGEGYVITRENSDPVPWYCEAVSYDTLISDGVNVLSNYWFSIKQVSPDSNELKLFAEEQQRYQIGPGNKIRLTRKDTTKESKTPVLTNEPLSLSNYKISYIDTIDTSSETPLETTIEDIDSPNYGWFGTSLLNIMLSNVVPQKLTSNQTFTLNQESDETITSTTVTDCYILSDRFMEKIGGKNIDVTSYMSLAANKLPINIITYKQLQNSNNSGSQDAIAVNVMYYENSFAAGISVEAINTPSIGEFNITLDKFKILEGSYLLHVSSDKDLTKLSVTCDNANIHPMFEGKDISNVYVLDVDANDENSGVETNLTISGTANHKYITLTVNPLYKYETTTLEGIDTAEDNVTFEELVIDSLRQLDKEELFDYTYKADNYIKNPLIAKEFLRDSHVFNKFTICEWQVQDEDDDIVVLQNIK